MEEATKQAIVSAVRQILGIAGGYVVGRGLLSEEQMTQIVGTVMAIIPIVWGVWDKFNAEKKTQDREAVAVNVGIKVADQTNGPTPPASSEQAQAAIKELAPQVDTK